MKNKTLARLAVIQSLYQYMICDETVPIENIIDQVIQYYNDETSKQDKYSQINISFFSQLTKFEAANLEKLDKIIRLNLGHNWNISSIHLTLLCLLRVAVCELLFFPETPTKVIISEYTNIATTILSEGEENFVNGILDNIAKQLRQTKDEHQ
jgi:N utilization substance protein B